MIFVEWKEGHPGCTNPMLRIPITSNLGSILVSCNCRKVDQLNNYQMFVLLIQVAIIHTYMHTHICEFGTRSTVKEVRAIARWWTLVDE